MRLRIFTPRLHPSQADPEHRPRAAVSAGLGGSPGQGSCDQDVWLSLLHSAAGTAEPESSVLQRIQTSLRLWRSYSRKRIASAPAPAPAPAPTPASPSASTPSPSAPVLASVLSHSTRSKPLTCNGFIQAPLGPFLLLFFSPLVLLRSLTASTTALHLGQAPLEGLL